MNKKELKLYEAPAQEVVELRLQGILCSSPDPKKTRLTATWEMQWNGESTRIPPVSFQETN